MKRKSFYFFTLLIVSLSFILFSCQGESEQEIFIPPNFDGIVDFAGYNFVYLQNGSDDDGEILSYKESTITADAALKRISELETAMNFNYIEKFTNDINAALQLETAVGDSKVSAVQWTKYSTAAVNCSRAGYFIPMSELTDYLDYTNSEKWGDKYRLESLCWNNEVYGVIPALWPEYDLSLGDFIFVINTDYIKELAEEDPREFVEAGVWTRDKLTEKIRAYSHTGPSGNWVYGLSTNKYHFAVSTALTSGVDIVSKDSSGKWSLSGIFSSTAFQSFEWMKNIFYGEYADCVTPMDYQDTEQVMKDFINRDAVMILMHSGYVYMANAAINLSISYQDVPFAILPFPNADISQYGNWMIVHEMVRFGINFPVFTQEPEAAAIIIDALYEPLEGFETQELIREYYARNVFHDQRDAEIFYKMMENNRQIYRADGLNNILHPIAFDTATKTLTEVIESVENQANEILEKYIIPTKESFIAVFGG